jgi:hypothetical protein
MTGWRKPALTPHGHLSPLARRFDQDHVALHAPHGRPRARAYRYASIRHIAVSLPYTSQLIDHVKYMEPQDVKPPEGDTECRRQRSPRAPSMRFLVKLALKCESAEELGKRLRRRYQRQHQRRGLAPGRAEGELAAELYRLLMHD